MAASCHNTTGSNVNQCGRLCGGVKLEQVRENVPYLRVLLALAGVTPPPPLTAKWLPCEASGEGEFSLADILAISSRAER